VIYINERVKYMSVKEQLISMINFMGENEANRLLLYVKDVFVLKTKTWDDVEEDDPTQDEIELFTEYYSNK